MINKRPSSTDVLREEHRLMERAMVVFVEIINKLETGVALDRRKVAEMMQAFKAYVELWHHPKEDFVLSILRDRGVSSSDYPMRAFYEEHDRIEPLLAALHQAAQQYSQFAESDSANLAKALSDIVDLYPGHMWRADHLLFPLAKARLADRDQEALIEQYDSIETMIGSDVVVELKAILEELSLDEGRVA